MAGRNAREAFTAFADPLQQNVSCLANDVLIVSHRGRHASGQIHALTLANGPIAVSHDLTLDLGLMYEIVHTDEPGKGPYKVATRAYDYAVRDSENRTMVSYHWHPLGQSRYTDPHIHVPSMWHGVHLPCERTSMESVVRLCIQELGASPRRDDWADVLAVNEGRFKLWRSWSNRPEPPKG